MCGGCARSLEFFFLRRYSSHPTTPSKIAPAAAPTPIPALAPALSDPLEDSSLVEGVGAERVESVGEAVGETSVLLDDVSVVYRLGSTLELANSFRVIIPIQFLQRKTPAHVPELVSRR